MRRDEGARARADGDPLPHQAERSIRRWKISELLGDAREAIVEHAGQDYRLRLTANNKLILTK
jgi:hemin uptake protein HemP